MSISCPYCAERTEYVIDDRTVVRHGVYRRTSDSRPIERYRCRLCGRTFSKATTDPCVRQIKRQKNKAIFELFASGVSGRRIARLQRVSRTTVARKLIFLGAAARDRVVFETAFRPTSTIQFDDLETFEHSKCKPLSVTLAVETGTRRILGFRVASMGANGRLVHKARRLYPPRVDERAQMRRELFKELAPSLVPGALITSDSNPYYVEDVRRYFPGARHVRVRGKRGSSTGSGELKKVRFDPLFSLNHTCAMFRANVCRLIRRTWCTTKRKDRLADHLAIYAAYHNEHLDGRGAAAPRPDNPHPGGPV